MMAKDIQKSVRLAPDMYEYIDKYRGDNFSAKLSNLVYDARKGEKQRVARLKDLDNRIEDASRRFSDLSKDMDVFNRITRDAAGIERDLMRLRDRSSSHVALDDKRRPPGKSPPGIPE